MKTNMTARVTGATWVMAAMLGVAAPAAAEPFAYLDNSAGGACQPAYSADPNLIFNNNWVENVGTTNRYVVCGLQMYDVFAAGTPLLSLNLAVKAGATAGTAICTAQTGAFYSGANQINTTQVRNVVLAAGDYGTAFWDTGTLPRTAHYHVITLNCRIPPGFKMGLIEMKF